MEVEYSAEEPENVTSEHSKQNGEKEKEEQKEVKKGGSGSLDGPHANHAPRVRHAFRGQ